MVRGMKSAREWAEEIVEEPSLGDDSLWAGSLGGTRLEPMYSHEAARDDVEESIGYLRSVIYRIQADARAPLERLLREAANCIDDRLDGADDVRTSQMVDLLLRIEDALT